MPTLPVDVGLFKLAYKNYSIHPTAQFMDFS